MTKNQKALADSLRETLPKPEPNPAMFKARMEQWTLMCASLAALMCETNPAFDPDSWFQYLVRAGETDETKSPLYTSTSAMGL